MSKMILAEKIADLRKKEGWSQEELAERLGVSRQSVSKWEGGASIPDIDKIIAMSGLFGVSTDYLLRDELGQQSDALVTEVEEPGAGSPARSVSVEEANDFLDLKKNGAGRLAAAVAMYILSPICLFLLAGLQEYAGLPISENAAGGIGIAILLVIVAAATAIIIFRNMELQKYEYMEKEILDLQYGVQGIVTKRKESYDNTFRIGLVLGVTICILSAVPLMLTLSLCGENEESMYLIAGLVILLAMVAAGVYLIVRVSEVHGAFQMLLQEGDYTIEKKSLEKKTSAFSGIYWCLVTAVFLFCGFYTEEWADASLIWPIAAVLFASVKGIAAAIVKAKSETKR